jgi:DNA-binding GntR family transcriptional regulator
MAGARLPTEAEIGAAFGVSRTVIRKALDILVKDGAITRRQGAGTFVNPPRRKLRAIGVLEALLRRREGLGLQVRSARQERATAEVAGFLEMSSRSRRVTHVTAVLTVEDEPLSVLDSFLPTELLPWLPTAVRMLERGKESPKVTDIALREPALETELSFFSEWGGPQLGAKFGSPALIGRLIQFAAVGRNRQEVPIEFSHLIFRPDQVQIISGRRSVWCEQGKRTP